MSDLRTQITGLLVAAPLLCGGLVEGIISTPQSSCLTSPLTSAAISSERDAQSYLVRDYRSIDDDDLLYSMQVMEKLWTYFVDKAESFTPEEMAVIDKEFWNLG